MRQMLAHTAAGKSGRASDTPLHRRRHSCIIDLAMIVRADRVQHICPVQHGTCQLSIMLVFVELFWRVGDAVLVAVTGLAGLQAPVHCRFARLHCTYTCACVYMPPGPISRTPARWHCRRSPRAQCPGRVPCFAMERATRKFNEVLARAFGPQPPPRFPQSAGREPVHLQPFRRSSRPASIWGTRCWQRTSLSGPGGKRAVRGDAQFAWQLGAETLVVRATQKRQTLGPQTRPQQNKKTRTN